MGRLRRSLPRLPVVQSLAWRVAVAGPQLSLHPVGRLPLVKRRLRLVLAFLLLGAAGCVVAAWTSALVFSPRKTVTIRYHDGTGKVEVRHPPANIEHGWLFHSLTREVPLDDGYVEITLGPPGLAG